VEWVLHSTGSVASSFPSRHGGADYTHYLQACLTPVTCILYCNETIVLVVPHLWLLYYCCLLARPNEFSDVGVGVSIM
jgi:hypothetical protein